MQIIGSSPENHFETASGLVGRPAKSHGNDAHFLHREYRIAPDRRRGGSIDSDGHLANERDAIKLAVEIAGEDVNRWEMRVVTQFEMPRLASQHQFYFNQTFAGDESFNESERTGCGLDFNLTDIVFKHVKQFGQLVVGNLLAQGDFRSDGILESEPRRFNALAYLSQDELCLGDQVARIIRREIVKLHIRVPAYQ